MRLKIRPSNDSEDVTSYTLGLGGTVQLGPAYIKATISYCQNPSAYGQTNFLVGDAIYTYGAGGASIVDGDVEDGKLLQGTFVVGAKFNQSVGVEAGFGYGNIKKDIAAWHRG